MSSRRTLVSAGPIPSKLDSVKYITNRFKGRTIVDMAHKLASWNNIVDLVVWKHSPVKQFLAFKSMARDGSIIHEVDDAVDYYETMERLAPKYSAFVLGAAVANLMPSYPYEGKFPSHRYQEGEEFEIQFEIAPRTIDMIKHVNPRCCLIGYKLYDGTHEELIKAAKITLVNSHANAIIANDPKNLMVKHVLLPDGATITLNAGNNVQPALFIDGLIRLKHHKSVRVGLDRESILREKNELPILVCEHFEKYIKKGHHGACAVRGNGCHVMTSRNHEGISIVLENNKMKDWDNPEISFAGHKPTKNAPLLFDELANDYVFAVHHRHVENYGLEVFGHSCPGTTEEMESKSSGDYYIEKHGTIEKKYLYNTDWSKYYELYPDKYFKTHPLMMTIYDETEGKGVLDVGCNTMFRSEFWLDPNIHSDRPGRVTYETLGKYEYIILNNSINYLTEEEIDLLIAALQPGGMMVANTFADAPKRKITENEIVYSTDTHVYHILWDGQSRYYQHSFYNRGFNFWHSKNFLSKLYNNKRSRLLTIVRPK